MNQFITNDNKSKAFYSMGYTNILEEKNRNHQEFVPNDVIIMDKMVFTDGFNQTNHFDANNPTSH